MRSGVFPDRPRTMALSVLCPLSVHADDPKTVASIRATLSPRPCLKPRTKVAAAFIGPTVCVAPFQRTVRASKSDGEAGEICLITQGTPAIPGTLTAPPVALPQCVGSRSRTLQRGETVVECDHCLVERVHHLVACAPRRHGDEAGFVTVDRRRGKATDRVEHRV